MSHKFKDRSPPNEVPEHDQIVTAARHHHTILSIDREGSDPGRVFSKDSIFFFGHLGIVLLQVEHVDVSIFESHQQKVGELVLDDLELADSRLLIESHLPDLISIDGIEEDNSLSTRDD